MSDPGKNSGLTPLTVAGLAALFCVALTAVYWNHFDNDFQFDDSHTIVNNAAITDIGNLPTLFTDASMTSSLPTNQAYRPIVTALNTIDYWIAGDLDPRVFHWHIFIEFLVLLVLLYHTLIHVFELASGKRHRLVALAATAFFAFHTTTAETINYIIARSDGFSALMVLAGFLIYGRNRGWKRQLGLIPLVIGSLAKPTTLMLAPLLAVFTLMMERPSVTVAGEKGKVVDALRRTVAGTASYFLVGAAMFWFTRTMYSGTWLPGGSDPIAYLVTQSWVIPLYLKYFILPMGLTADTDLELIRNVLDPRVLWGLVILLMVIAVAWFSARNRRTLPIAFGILWFFICLAPSSSVIPLAEVMNHHRTFLPYIGLVMASAWALFLVIQRYTADPPPAAAKAICTAAFLLLLGLHAFGAWQRNEVWDSNESLWHDVTVKSPNNGRGMMNYGLALMGQGDFEGALAYFEKALNTPYGRHPYLYVNLGIAKGNLGVRRDDAQLIDKAQEYFLQAIRLGPGYPQTHYRYAEWLVKSGRPGEAVPHLQRSLALAPANRGARELLDRTLLMLAEVAEQSRQAASAQNTPAGWLNASLASFRAGDYRHSLEAARRALQLDPNYAPAHNNECAALNELGDYRDAIAACKRALAIEPDFELARANLQWAQQQLGGGE